MRNKTTRGWCPESHAHQPGPPVRLLTFERMPSETATGRIKQVSAERCHRPAIGRVDQMLAERCGARRPQRPRATRLPRRQCARKNDGCAPSMAATRGVATSVPSSRRSSHCWTRPGNPPRIPPSPAPGTIASTVPTSVPPSMARLPRRAQTAAPPPAASHPTAPAAGAGPLRTLPPSAAQVRTLGAPKRTSQRHAACALLLLCHA